jgi:hypothetical protein
MIESIQTQTTVHPVIQRFLDAVNRHDPDAISECFAVDVRIEQPAHPGRSFQGNGQIRQNWTTAFADVADLKAELVSSAEVGNTIWTELHYTGMRADSNAYELRGVTIQEIEDARIKRAALYLAPVDADGAQQ